MTFIQDIEYSVNGSFLVVTQNVLDKKPDISYSKLSEAFIFITAKLYADNKIPFSHNTNFL
jgi:hypothetical protein